MTATGATNAEDALAQVSGPKGLTDQSAVPADKRVQQFVIFFTDGMPTAFRGKFKNKGTDNIDAVVCGTGNTCDTVWNQLGQPASETLANIDPGYTGDGNTPQNFEVQLHSHHQMVCVQPVPHWLLSPITATFRMATGQTLPQLHLQHRQTNDPGQCPGSLRTTPKT